MNGRLSRRDVETVTRVLDTDGRFDALVLTHPEHGHSVLIRWLVKGRTAMVFESAPRNWPMFCQFVMEVTAAGLVEYVRRTYNDGWVVARNDLPGIRRRVREGTNPETGVPPQAA